MKNKNWKYDKVINYGRRVCFNSLQNLVESPSVPPTLWFRRPCLLYAVVLIFRSLLTLRFHYKRCIFAHSTQSLIHTLTCTPIRLCRVWMKLLISYFERVLPLIWTKKHMYGSIKYLDITNYKVQGFQEYLKICSSRWIASFADVCWRSVLYLCWFNTPKVGGSKKVQIYADVIYEWPLRQIIGKQKPTWRS